MELLLVVLASAAIASFLSGLLGIGGALVLVPLLFYAPPLVGLAAIPVPLITGLSMTQAFSGSLVSLWRHRGYGNVSMAAIRAIAPAMAIGAFVGAIASSGTPDRVLLLVFAALAVAGALALLVPAAAPAAVPRPARLPLTMAIGAVFGGLSGLVGVGGLWLITPLLIHLVRLPVRVAIGTSLGIGLFASLAGVVGKAASAQIDPLLGAGVFAMAIAAAPLGAALSVRTPTRALTTLLALMVLVVAVGIAVTALAAP